MTLRKLSDRHQTLCLGKPLHEQELWNECARLIANAVVYYNSLILSDVLKELNTLSDVRSAEASKRVSPLAWQHINFNGRYQFGSDTPPVEFAEIARELALKRCPEPQNQQIH